MKRTFFIFTIISIFFYSIANSEEREIELNKLFIFLLRNPSAKSESNITLHLTYFYSKF